MKSMALFADANVILEVLLPDRSKTQAVEKLLQGKAICVSMLTIHLAYHFGLKEKYEMNRIKQVLDNYAVLDVTTGDYREALRMIKNNDFEDALQLAVALRSGCQAVLTLDREFAKTYKDKINFIVP